MKLTENQLNALVSLKEEKSLSHDSPKAKKTTMNSLYFKGLVRSVNYANGPHWEMTDAGHDLLTQQKL